MAAAELHSRQRFYQMGVGRACRILMSPVLALGVRVTGPRPPQPGRPATADRGLDLHPGKLDWRFVPVPTWLSELGPRRSPTVAGMCDFTPHPVLELCGAAAFGAVTSSVPVEARLPGSGRSTTLEYLPPRSHSLYPEPRGVLRYTHVAQEPPPLAGQALPTDKSGLVTNG